VKATIVNEFTIEGVLRCKHDIGYHIAVSHSRLPESTACHRFGRVLNTNTLRLCIKMTEQSPSICMTHAPAVLHIVSINIDEIFFVIGFCFSAMSLRTSDFPTQCRNQTCTKSAVDLHSMFLRPSHGTGVRRQCSISRHIPDDSPYSYLQTSDCHKQQCIILSEPF